MHIRKLKLNFLSDMPDSLVKIKLNPSHDYYFQTKNGLFSDIKILSIR